ncbi:MAG: hypothetical protein AAFX85_05140 [Pseudomonadota bacterium]
MLRTLTVVTGTLLISASAVAQHKQFVYPNEGQSAEQQQRDEFECYQWAAAQSGFDPLFSAAQPAAPASTPESPSNDRSDNAKATLGSAAKGAALGAVVAEVTGNDAGDGALVGAGGGVLKSQVARRREQQKASEAQAAYELQAQEEAKRTVAQLEQRTADYLRANATCLKAKGYTVN